jgi:xanthine dehydrogenase YagS FAD-binding subunit
MLSEAAGLAATPQIRNVATVAGNIAQRPRCWYFRSDTFPCARKGGDICYAQKGDNRYHALFDNSACAVVHASSTAGPLVALGASVVTNKRVIPIDKFFVGTPVDITKEHVLEPGEIITEIVIPPAQKSLKTAYREAGEKESNDWALFSASVALEMQKENPALVKEARVVLGGVAAIPYRAPAVEVALAGKPITTGNAKGAAEVAFGKASPFEQNAYKIPLGKTILKRAILAAAGQPELGSGG